MYIRSKRVLPLMTNAADDVLIFFIFRKNKTGISCELSAKQTIHMKCQALFSLELYELLIADLYFSIKF